MCDRPSDPSTGESPGASASSSQQPCPPGDKACGADALAQSVEELKAACDEVGGGAPCKDEAQRMVDAMVKAWNRNYGNGRNTSRDNVGGYLCWDWSRVFAESARGTNPKFWSINEGMVHKKSSSVVHFFVVLKPKGVATSKGTRYIDDGWFDGEMVHGPPWPPSSNWTPGTWKPPANRYTEPPIR